MLCCAIKPLCAWNCQVSWLLTLAQTDLLLLPSAGGMACTSCQSGRCASAHHAYRAHNSCPSCTHPIMRILSVPACLSARGPHKYSSAIAIYSDSDLFFYFLTSAYTCNMCSFVWLKLLYCDVRILSVPIASIDSPTLWQQHPCLRLDSTQNVYQACTLSNVQTCVSVAR